MAATRTTRPPTACRSTCAGTTCATSRFPAAQTVVANLLRPLLLVLAGRPELDPPALIVGGLLRDQADEVATAFTARRGLVESQRREAGEWASLLLERG